MNYEKKYNEALNWMRELYPGLHGATKEDAEYYFPELRESEDERVRQGIVETIKQCTDMLDPKNQKRMLAYLEKQKEHFRDATKMVERSLEDDHIIGFVYDLLNEIEWKDDWAMSKDECLRLLSNYIPQKPAEWSEEDSDNLERVDNYLWMLDDYVGDDCATPQGKADKIRGNIQGILSPWLKSLPERFNLQPKQEWSEEDKEILEKLHRLLVICRGEKKFIQEADYNKMDNLLKSLRP